MKLVVWSNQAGHSKVTSSVAAMAALDAITSERKSCVLSTVHNSSYLQVPFMGVAKENLREYYQNTGIDVLLRTIKSGTAQAKDIMDSSTQMINGRLNVFTGTTVSNPTFYESTIMGAMSPLCKALDTTFDIAWIDTTSGVNRVSANMLKEADIIIVGLPQSEMIVEDFFANYSFDFNKVMFIFGDYDKDRKFSCANACKKYKKYMNKDNTAYILHNAGFGDACDSGKLLPFMQINNKAKKSDENYEFMMSVRKALKVLESVQEHKRLLEKKAAMAAKKEQQAKTVQIDEDGSGGVWI